MKKKITILILGLTLLLCSCKKNEDGELVLPDISSDAAKIIEYSVEYYDESTKLSRFATGTLEQSEPLAYGFIVDKVIQLSEADLSASCSFADGVLTVDFDDSFFLSECNTLELENSILTGIYKNIPYHFDEVKCVVFVTDGILFDSKYHHFPQGTKFVPELLGDVKPEITQEYIINYYDIITDSNLEYKGAQTFYGSVDPNFFVNKIAELYGMNIVCNGVTEKDSVMSVDLSSEFAPLNGTGSYEEARILDSIADCLLMQFPEVDAISFTADGGEYESGHLYFAVGDIYKMR